MGLEAEKAQTIDASVTDVLELASLSKGELASILGVLLTDEKLSLDAVRAEIEMKKRQQILDSHTSIWFSESDQTWNTHIRVNGKRKLIKRKRKEDVEEQVIQHYRKLDNNPTLEELFHLWIQEKLNTERGFEPQSADRYESDFIRFFVTTGFSKNRIRNITEEKLEAFIRKVIYDDQLTRKKYKTIPTILKGILNYARKKGYTEIIANVFFAGLDLEGTFTESWTDKETKIFRTDEIPLLKQYFLDRGTIWDLGCLLCLETGMRVGELSALKHEDWQDRILKIRRSEKKVKDATGHWILTVEEYPKTEAGNRDIILTDGAVDTLQRIVEINPSGEYLFLGSRRQRIRGNSFNKRITSAQEDLGLHHRSIHKFRATYGTTLLDGGCDDATVQRQMGHKDISTTRKYYYFSNKTQEEQRKQIENAIKF